MQRNTTATSKASGCSWLDYWVYMTRLLGYTAPMSTAWVECWKCDVCGFRWIKGEIWPERCASSKCRKRNWNTKEGVLIKPPDADQTHIGGPHSSISAVELASWGKLAATPVVNGNAAMQAFMPKLPANTPIEPEQPLLRPCPKIGWDHPDGDPRKCRLTAGHKGNCSPGEKVDA